MYERYQGSAMQQDYQKLMAEKQAYASIQDQQMQAGLAGAFESTSPHGPLESAMDSIAHGMQEAFCALERMAEALRLVLQPEAPTPIGNDAKSCSQPPASPAVHRLHALREQLEVLTTRMNALRCRLDA